MEMTKMATFLAIERSATYRVVNLTKTTECKSLTITEIAINLLSNCSNIIS